MVRDGFKLTEVGEIPEEWEVVALGNIGTFKNGINKPKSAFGHGFPFVNLMDIFGKPIISKYDLSELLDTSERERKDYNLIDGDVLFIRSSVKPSGVGLTSVVNGTILDCTYSGFLIRFRAENDQLDNGFKRYCFYDARFRRSVIASSSVSANTNVNQVALSNLLLPLPPLPEQRRIAAILSDVDGLLAALDAVVAKKAAVKAGVMEELLTGERRLARFGGEWLNPVLNSYASLRSGYTFKSDTYNPAGIYKVITIANVQAGFMTTSDCNKITDIPTDIQSHQKLDIGDLLISMTGNVGRVAVVTEQNLLLNQRVGKIESSGIDRQFLYHRLNSKDFVKAMIDAAKGGAQPNLSSKDILDYNFPLPPLPEQRAIAAVLTAMDEELAALRLRVAKLERVKAGLLGELLSGRLRV